LRDFESSSESRWCGDTFILEGKDRSHLDRAAVTL